MRHIFVYNPMAGKDTVAEVRLLRERMHRYDGRLSYEFYATKCPRDATEYVRMRCEAEPHTELRFYACGGDGTANEVMQGLVGFPNASMTCYPCGSGNDYVKYYGGASRFRDLDMLLLAKETRVDLMRVGWRYAMNVVNFGFDTTVASTMTKVRHKKLIGGDNAYTTGIVKALVTSMRNDCTVWVDGERINNGKILLCTVSNGKYVGGSFCCAPRSENDDGLLEVCLVKPISHFTFINLVKAYKEGNHLDDPRFSKYIEYRRAKRVRVKGKEGFAYTLDGEVIPSSDFTIEVVPHALRFAVPPRRKRGMKR